MTVASAAQIESRVITVLARVSRRDAAELTADTTLIGELGIDSLKMAELSILLEQEFGVPLFVPMLLLDADDPYLLSVSSLVEFVGKGLGQP